MMYHAMKKTLGLAAICATALMSLPALALAHEEGSEVRGVYEADWVGPLAAILIITAVVLVAKEIKKSGRSRDITTQ